MSIEQNQLSNNPSFVHDKNDMVFPAKIAKFYYFIFYRELGSVDNWPRSPK